MTLRQIVEAVQAVQAVESLEAIPRIPKVYRNLTFFSDSDWWRFDFRVPKATSCISCKIYANNVYIGGDLRFRFPYLTVMGEDEIGGPDDGDGLVHPNCGCRLIRVEKE